MSSTSQPKDSPVGWVGDHIRQYVESGGTDGYEWRGTTILLLTTTGRKTGTQHRTALIYRADGDSFVIVASKGGAPKHPAWYLNLTANPDVTVQVKDEEFAGRARLAEGDERERLWKLMVEVWPSYDEYQAKTEREIPVVVIDKV
ncbi:MAG TPA: nitroreductase family deazaflavin-dependent oxidoreductase [Pseudonocardiaceae bacterium]|nr:nitroreductase family deazaflavin-dependent oxidoreductase [Pseudonocardiaceae bacterium]